MNNKYNLPSDLKMPIFMGPSGVGKSSIVRRMLHDIPELILSVSDTTRELRKSETHGVDYYHRSLEEFLQLKKQNAFMECEEVYPGKWYGTRIDEVRRLYERGRIPIFDIDVNGAKKLQETYPENFSTILVTVPEGQLPARLKDRQTEKPEDLEIRIAKAEDEFSIGRSFAKYEIQNDNLDMAIHAARQIVREILSLPAV